MVMSCGVQVLKVKTDLSKQCRLDQMPRSLVSNQDLHRLSHIIR